MFSHFFHLPRYSKIEKKNNVKSVVAQPHRLKSTFFEYFSSLLYPKFPLLLGHLVWKFSNYLDFSLWGKTVRCLIKLHLIWIKWFHEFYFFLHLFFRIFSLFFIFSFVFCHFFWRFWVRIRRILPFSTSFVSRLNLTLFVVLIIFVFAFLNFPAIIFTDGSSDNYGFGFVFVFKLILFVKSFFYVISEKN